MGNSSGRSDFAAIQRQSARRLAIALVLAQQPKITRAEKRAEFVPLVGLVQLIQNPETGVTGVGRDLIFECSGRRN